MGTYVTDGTQWVDVDGGPSIPFGAPLDPPIADKHIGIYTSGNNTDNQPPDTALDTLTSGWPTQPNLASFYFNWGSNFGSNAQLVEYAGQDRLIHVALLQKDGHGGHVLWADMASGSQDSAIITMLGYLDALPASRIIVCCDNEPDNGNTTAHPTGTGQSAADYKAAAERFFDLVAANTGPHVEAGLHWAGGNVSLVKSMMPTASKITNIGWDPYKKGTETTLDTSEIFAEFINNVIVPKGLEDKNRHICETGIKTDTFTNGGSYTTAEQIAFYQQVPGAMDDNQIQSVVWFRANSGKHDYIPTDPSVDDAFRDMLDATIGG